MGQCCVLESPAFERVALPTLTEEGKSAPVLRFGDPRVMALFGAYCLGLTALGFTSDARMKTLPKLKVSVEGWKIKER